MLILRLPEELSGYIGHLPITLYFRVTHHLSQQSSPHTVWSPNMLHQKSGRNLEDLKLRPLGSPLARYVSNVNLQMANYCSLG